MIYAAVGGAAVGLALGLYLARKPASSATVQHAARETRVARAEAARIDTVYQTIRAIERVTRVRYDTTRDTVVIQRDTGRVVYVAKVLADAEIKACTAVVTTCEARAAADSLEKAALRAEIAAINADRPSRFRSVLKGAAWLGAGYVLGRAGVGRGASLSIPTPF